jgi:hypothetical protein
VLSGITLVTLLSQLQPSALASSGDSSSHAAPASISKGQKYLPDVNNKYFQSALSAPILLSDNTQNKTKEPKQKESTKQFKDIAIQFSATAAMLGPIFIMEHPGEVAAYLLLGLMATILIGLIDKESGDVAALLYVLSYKLPILFIAICIVEFGLLVTAGLLPYGVEAVLLLEAGIILTPIIQSHVSKAK